MGGYRSGVTAQVVWRIDRAPNGRLRGVLAPGSRARSEMTAFGLEMTAFGRMDQSMPLGGASLQPLPLEEVTALKSRIGNVPIFTILDLRDVTFLRRGC